MGLEVELGVGWAVGLQAEPERGLEKVPERVLATLDCIGRVRVAKGAALSGSATVRTVLVTGGARRIGRAIALMLAREGWNVGVHCRGSCAEALEVQAECAAWEGRSAVFDADFGDETAVRGLVPRVVAALGRLDAIVHSASVFEFDDVASFGYAAMERHMRVHAGAATLLGKALHDHASARADTAVLVVLLDQKLWNLNPDYLSYTLSKAAMETATTMLAQALAPCLRVVGVAPGLTLPGPTIDAERFAALHRLSPLGRSSMPEDVAAAVSFALANPAITGTTLLVDGGQHLLPLAQDFSRMVSLDTLSTCQSAPIAPCFAPCSLAMQTTDSARDPAETGGQTLYLTGLRFEARVGVLDAERVQPQPIQVDAALYLGQCPLLPEQDDIACVLDYRSVRAILLEECHRGHVHLLETLLGKLCQRLQQIPGVLGVRIKITKLAVFADCEVALQMEVGRWS
ncbi:SDR family oxidoreductase [Candidatus Symbiobacter mobilis]